MRCHIILCDKELITILKSTRHHCQPMAGTPGGYFIQMATPQSWVKSAFILRSLTGTPLLQETLRMTSSLIDGVG